MPIENRNLKPGNHLMGRYHKQPYKCEVIEREGGKIGYRLEDGREFKSPSAAGMAITGHSCDGWIFWSIDTTSAPAAPEAETANTQTDAATATTEVSGKSKWDQMPKAQFAAGLISRVPNQKGVPEGQVRWYCHECAKSFMAAKGQTPQACPQGHQAS